MYHNNTIGQSTFSATNHYFRYSHYHWICIFTSDEKEPACHVYKRVTPKVMPPILLCWHTMSEADVGSMAVDIEPFLQITLIFFFCFVTDSS